MGGQPAPRGAGDLAPDGLRIGDPVCRRARQDRALQRLLWKWLVTLCSVLAVMVIGLAAARLTLRRLEDSLEGRIYPRVYALGTALGGLTADEARAALAGPAQLAQAGEVTLRDGEQRWTLSGASLGVRYDVEAVVGVALAVGHGSGSWPARLSAWLRREHLPALWTVEPAIGRAAIAALAARVNMPAKEAALALREGQLVALPGEAGRALDVEATLAALATTVRSRGAGEAGLIFRPLAPRVADARPALPRAEAILRCPLTLAAYDAASGETLSWTLDRAVVASWLRVVPAVGAPGVAVEASPEAVRATLARWAAGLSGGRGLRLDEATAQVLAAFKAGGGMAQLYLTHPPRSHSVEAGEWLGAIAARYGVPLALVTAANPGIDPDWLEVGQELAIPSLDALLPNLPVPAKRIVVSRTEQRLRAYENGELRWDWPCSTGVPAAPTWAGTFQVLQRAEKAPGSWWGTWMPHFLAIYPTGEGDQDGIHALPVSDAGVALSAGCLGRPASLGCIVLGEAEAASLYEWAEVGVTVVVE